MAIERKRIGRSRSYELNAISIRLEPIARTGKRPSDLTGDPSNFGFSLPSVDQTASHPNHFEELDDRFIVAASNIDHIADPETMPSSRRPARTNTASVRT
jgi:hypothetical protein